MIAAKSHYFGVGGGTALFKTACEKTGVFAVRTAREFSDGASSVREILVVTFKR